MLGELEWQTDQVRTISSFGNRKGEAWLDRERRYGRAGVLERL